MQIVIWGCGEQAEYIVPVLENRGINVDICVDASEDKQGTYFMDKYKVYSPDILQRKEDYFVIVTPLEYHSICKQLILWGYTRGLEEGGNYCLGKEFVGSLLLNWSYKNKAKMYFVFAPSIYRKVDCSAQELALKTMENIFNVCWGSTRIEWLQSAPPHIKNCYEEFPYYSDEYIKNIFTGSKVIDRNGVLVQQDMKSEYVNVSGGMRVTTDQPEVYEHSIHFLGSSYIYGFGVEDKYTIPSSVQRKINDAGYMYRCYNHGIRGMNFYQYPDKIESIDYRKGDYVVIYIGDDHEIKEFLMRNSVPYIDLNEYLQYCTENIFFDRGSHLNYKGNTFVADILYDLMFSYSFTGRGKKALNKDFLEQEYDEINKWIQSLRKNFYVGNGQIGAIVMSCNPFTLGHKYLIDIASRMVDWLYVFVVSEERFMFPFDDRIRLVKEGTYDLKNITVIPSGKYVISSITFPEYFSKEDNQDAIIDMTMDVDIFGRIIAKELNISIRFVGEELLDLVTKQYNETLKRVLPKYGVKLLEIPRLRKNNNIISASIVRTLFTAGKISELEQYVPEFTFRYLTSLRDCWEEKVE